MTHRRHYSDDELAQYAFDPATFAEKAEVAAHLATCANCREELAWLERIEHALSDEDVWDIAEELCGEPPSPSEGLRERARVIEEERAKARAALEPLLVSPLRFRNAGVEADERLRTAGGVSVLYEAAKELHEQQPKFALLVANAAVTIASKLAAGGELRSMLHLGRAYLERGRTLFLIGRYKDAEQALDYAERTYEADEDATEWDRATVWLVRANLYVETERLAEASILAAGAARQFRIFGDVNRYLQARLMLANVQLMEGNYRASAAAAEQVIEKARARGDILLLGRALHNCGEAYLSLREYERAVPQYMEAYAIWEELGLEAHRIRTNWSLATIDVETGRLEEGIRRLEETYREFEAIGVINDTALARMDLAEALLLVGRPDRVPELLRDVVVTFASEGMMRNANRALADLKEALAQRRVTPELIRHVREYIEHLPFHPTARFVPLK